MAQSHISESLCPTSVSAVSAARPFCVVCGHCTGNLVPRRSGFKCPTCVGKKGNKQWTRLQRKQAAQLYTDLMQQQQEQPAGLFISQPSYDSTLSPTESSTTRDTKSTKDAMLINEYLDQAAVYKGDAVTDENFSSPSSPAPVAALNSVSSSATPPAAPLVTEKPRLPARNGKKVAAPPPPARVPRRHSDITGAPRTPRSRLSGSSNTLPLTATDSEIVIPSREASRHTADAGFVIRVDDTKTPEEEPLGDTRRTSCSTGSPEAKKHSKNRRRDSLEDSRSPSTALNQTQPDGDPYDHMPEIRGNAVEFSGDSSCCDSSQCSSDSKEMDDERPYHIPSADDPSAHEEEEDDKRSVASFDLAHISIRIKHVSAEDAEKAAGKKAGSKKSATSGGGHPLAFKKGELNQSLSQSRGVLPREGVQRAEGTGGAERQVHRHPPGAPA
ncbi:hypothetical protein AGDE_14586 [Angomonas deanei]|nr:hypothetical protein AGDE_14586 [Angomonas deanei]|eukprot:EPY20581.1 hypothetical protein AGDE_14586 [Angomonas deanei]